MPIVFKGSLQEIRILGTFSLPAYLGSLLLGPTSWFCATILVQQPNGYDEMGSFNAANQWRQIILFIPNTVIGSALPVMTNLYSQGGHAPLKKLIRTNLRLNTSITIAGAVLVIFFRMPCRALLRFAYMYLLKLGFLDGVPDYHYCRMLAIYEYMIVLKMKEIRRRTVGESI